MKREELMINDMVFDYTNSPVKVCAVGQDIVVKNSFGIGSLDPNELSSIPLTKEILVKNGFEKNDRGDFVIDDTIVIAKENYCPKNYYACTWYQEDFDDEIYYIGICELTFVHQLQHLLRLAGIEKEIEL